MKWFAPIKRVIDTNVNTHEPPPNALMEGGFQPPTQYQPGSPIVAQWFNWLFSHATVLSPFYVPFSGGVAKFRNPLSATAGNGRVVKNMRIYSVWPNGTQKYTSSFIVNGNSATSWTGYSGSDITVTEDYITIKQSYDTQAVGIEVVLFGEAP